MDGESDSEDDSDDEEEDLDDDPDATLRVLQHVEPDLRAMYAALPPQERVMFIVNLQIQLFEEQGITFGDPEEDDDNNDDEQDNPLFDGNRDEGESGIGDGEEQDGNGGMPPTLSPDDDQPTPMDVDFVHDQGEEERPAWKGPPGGWPADEEL